MSWSITVHTTTPDTIEADLIEARRAAIEGNQLQGCLDEAVAAADVAISAAIALVSAVIRAGSTDTPLVVSLSGHANPGNMPVEGWANDTITVNITNMATRS